MRRRERRPAGWREILLAAAALATFLVVFGYSFADMYDGVRSWGSLAPVMMVPAVILSALFGLMAVFGLVLLFDNP